MRGPWRQLGGPLKPAGKALKPAERALEPPGRALEPAERRLRASQLATKGLPTSLRTPQLAPGRSQLALRPSQLVLRPCQLFLRLCQLVMRPVHLAPRPSRPALCAISLSPSPCQPPYRQLRGLLCWYGNPNMCNRSSSVMRPLLSHYFNLNETTEEEGTTDHVTLLQLFLLGSSPSRERSPVE